MHWVVCKTQVKEIERDFSREESEQLGGHIFQDKVATNPKGNFLCDCCYHFLLLEVVLYESVQSVQQGERA
jgi:hypothetical protein